MRIGFDATPLAAAKGGIGYHVENLVRALAATGEIEEILLFSNRAPVFDRGMPAGVRWIDRRLFPQRAPWMQFLLPLLIREEKPDLMHYPNFNASILLEHPFVVTFHDMVLYRHPEFFTWKKRYLTRSLMPLVARRAQGILTVSAAARADIVALLRMPAEKVFVVHHAPGDDFAPVADDAALSATLARHGLARPYILCVGTLEPRKNLDGLLRAFDSLKDETGIPHLLAVAGGRGWKYAPVFRTVAGMRHRDQVRFLDYVPVEDLPALYTGADLFVFPSFYEGFGTPPVEAMRCGAPTVASDIDALREVVADAAVLVDPRDIASIVSGMRRVLEDPALAARMRRSGFERGRLYSWARSAREAIDVYRTVLSRRRAGAPPLQR